MTHRSTTKIAKEILKKDYFLILGEEWKNTILIFFTSYEINFYVLVLTTGSFSEAFFFISPYSTDRYIIHRKYFHIP